MTSVPPPTRRRRVHYPETDGKPLGESDRHVRLFVELLFMLRQYLRNVRAYVAGNMFLYYEEGNPRAVVAPDVFVVKEIEPDIRRTYRLWEEGRAPDIIFELTSRKTRKVDETIKPALYARLGVSEYILFDPEGEWLKPRLQGFRLVNGVYTRITEFPLHSRVLSLHLRVEDDTLRLYDAATGRRLLTSDEEVLERQATEQRLELEMLERQATEQRLELEMLERQATEQRLDAEQRARAALEAELARLRTLLGKADQEQEK